MAKSTGQGNKKLNALSRREREIMDILYQRGQATVAEVLEALADPPGYSAVRATLNVLVDKGHAQHRQDGPRYVYLPAIPASSARTAAVENLVKTFFGRIPPGEREGMTPAQVFAGMNEMLKDVMPAVYTALRRTSIEVRGVQVGPDGSALVQYTVRTPDGEAVDVDRANLHEGRWYLRTKEAPAATVEKFRMLLGLSIETGPEVKLSPPAGDAAPR